MQAMPSCLGTRQSTHSALNASALLHRCCCMLRRHFAPDWHRFARLNPRFSSWQGFEAAISFSSPQEQQYYMQRRELYQACSALLLAEEAARTATGRHTGELTELQQLVEAALWMPPPAAAAGAEMLVVQHSQGSSASTPTAAGAAAVAAAALSDCSAPSPTGFASRGAPAANAGAGAAPSAAPGRRLNVCSRDSDECGEACERCGRVHDPSDGTCRPLQCTSCGLSGECSYGHAKPMQCCSL